MANINLPKYKTLIVNSKNTLNNSNDENFLKNNVILPEPEEIDFSQDTPFIIHASDNSGEKALAGYKISYYGFEPEIDEFGNLQDLEGTYDFVSDFPFIQNQPDKDLGVNVFDFKYPLVTFGTSSTQNARGGVYDVSVSPWNEIVSFESKRAISTSANIFISNSLNYVYYFAGFDFVAIELSTDTETIVSNIGSLFILKAALSNDDQYFAVLGSSTFKIYQLNLNSLSEIADITSQLDLTDFEFQNPVTSIVFTDNHLVVASKNDNVLVFNIGDWSLVQTITSGERTRIEQLKFTGDNDRLTICYNGNGTDSSQIFSFDCSVFPFVDTNIITPLDFNNTNKYALLSRLKTKLFIGDISKVFNLNLENNEYEFFYNQSVGTARPTFASMSEELIQFPSKDIGSFPLSSATQTNEIITFVSNVAQNVANEGDLLTILNTDIFGFSVEDAEVIGVDGNTFTIQTTQVVSGDIVPNINTLSAIIKKPDPGFTMGRLGVVGNSPRPEDYYDNTTTFANVGWTGIHGISQGLRIDNYSNGGVLNNRRRIFELLSFFDNEFISNNNFMEVTFRAPNDWSNVNNVSSPELGIGTYDGSQVVYHEIFSPFTFTFAGQRILRRVRISDFPLDETAYIGYTEQGGSEIPYLFIENIVYKQKLEDTIHNNNYWEEDTNGNASFSILFNSWSRAANNVSQSFRIRPKTTGPNLNWQNGYRPSSVFLNFNLNLVVAANLTIEIGTSSGTVLSETVFYDNLSRNVMIDYNLDFSLNEDITYLSFSIDGNENESASLSLFNTVFTVT